ncbi:hypothetical protein V1514DRAFT_344378 [Lipomyces japonicus]|uniref:uncharacterized protein n=1 Tax=Lipomyces japonicus TaxID=56871 RepID=UPI0034CD35C7
MMMMMNNIHASIRTSNLGFYVTPSPTILKNQTRFGFRIMMAYLINCLVCYKIKQASHLKILDRDFLDGLPNEEFQKTAPTNWMQQIKLHEALYKRSDKVRDLKSPALRPEELKKLESLEQNLLWLRNSRVLLLSDFIDRYQSGFICNRIGSGLIIGRHGYQTTAHCTLKYWNATFMNLHVASLSTNRPEWWWIKEMTVVPFEERWDTFYNETIKEVVGMNGIGPDLIIVHSGLWDLSYFTTSHKAHNKTEPRSLILADR